MCVSGVIYSIERGEKLTFKFRESSGKLGLKMTKRTRTDERKMVQLSYFVPGYVISTLILIIFIYRRTLEWSGE